jgi:DNA-binding CsgD family transcriptional regulator
VPGGGDHSSRTATFAARERERNVVELCPRGATFEQIGRQLNIERSTAYKAWQRALKRMPTADVETLRKAQSERLLVSSCGSPLRYGFIVLISWSGPWSSVSIYWPR